MRNRFKPIVDVLDDRNLAAVAIPIAPGVGLLPVIFPQQPAPTPPPDLPGSNAPIDPTVWTQPPEDLPEWGEGGAEASW